MLNPTSPVLPSSEEPLTEIVLGAGQTQYRPLPSLRLPDSTGTVITRWHLTWRDLLDLIRYRSLWVETWTFGGKYHPTRIHTQEPRVEVDLVELESDYQPPPYGREA